MITGTQHIGQCGFPSTGTGGWINHHRLFGLENFLNTVEHLQTQGTKLRTTVMYGRKTHGTQNSVGHRARAGNLQEVTTGGMEIQFQHVLLLKNQQFRLNFVFCIQNTLAVRIWQVKAYFRNEDFYCIKEMMRKKKTI